MDIRAATKVEDEISQSWLHLIDEEEDALLNEAVSHTIRQLSAEIRSNSTKPCVAEEPTNNTCNDHETTKPNVNCLRMNDEPKGSFADVLLCRNKMTDIDAKGNADQAFNEIKEDNSPTLGKRPREDSLNSLPAKISRNRHNSSSSSSTNSSNTSKRKIEYETDPSTLARRQKDIDYGKNTIGYDRYIQSIPKKNRAKEHPKTPPKNIKCSRRGWDGMVKLWRQQLHVFDPPDTNGAKVVQEKDGST
ncbi:histone RNA hairpin-binding protein isoform X2 [Diprion similis]|nr:histone RNA hairpin-binding protein isoform X2 [Diprion similis]